LRGWKAFGRMQQGLGALAFHPVTVVFLDPTFAENCRIG
jgi:hypothetical protein